MKFSAVLYLFSRGRYSKAIRCHLTACNHTTSNITLSMRTCNYWTGCDTGLLVVQLVTIVAHHTISF